ncbi:MAG: amino acid ABC transporter permease [Clostridia bacterium]|nr:amino acid ABC transporter permease [Clostridia bacterium]
MQALSAWFISIYEQFRFNIIDGDRYKMLMEGLGVTLTVALFAAVIGVLLGSVIALMRLSNARIGKWYPLRWLATIYVGVIRGTPVVVQLLIMYFIILLPFAWISKTTAAILCFGLNSAAYVSEMVRGGILSVDKGQTEAGRSLGLSGASTMLLIVLPQAAKNTLPSLFNEFIMLLKETSIVGYIGLMDLAKAGDYIRSRTYSAFFPLLTVAAIYLVIVMALTKVFATIERRMRKGDSN